MLHLIVKTAAPLLLAATGGLVTEIAGTLNIGLEGLMLIGAFSAIVGAGLGGSAFVGVLLATATAAGAALLFVAFAGRLRANIFITGLALNLLAVGLTAMLSTLLFSTQGVIRPQQPYELATITIPLIEDIPILGRILSGHTAFVPLSFGVALLTALGLRKTRAGLALRATGLAPEVVMIRGRNPDRYRAWAVIFSGVTCGLAGAALSLDLGAFVPNITAGRGWIALVIVFLGRRRVWGVLLASFLLAGAEYSANALQGSTRIPPTIALAIPYLITLLSMIAFAVVERIHSRARSG